MKTPSFLLSFSYKKISPEERQRRKKGFVASVGSISTRNPIMQQERKKGEGRMQLQVPKWRPSWGSKNHLKKRSLECQLARTNGIRFFFGCQITLAFL